MVRRLALLTALVVLTGCNRDLTTTEPMQPQMMVHALFDTAHDSVWLSISRVSYDTVVERAARDPVVGASVRVCGPGECVDFVEPDSAPGQYLGVFPGGVRSGGTYDLDARLGDGTSIQGSAKIPQAPAVDEPVDRTRVPAQNLDIGLTSREPLVIRWDTTGDAAGIVISAQPVAVFAGGQRFAPNRECHFVGSGATVVAPEDGWAQWTLSAGACWGNSARNARPLPTDSILLDLAVIAVDSAYVRYFEAGNATSIPREDLASNLVHAIGLFSGMSRTRRHLMLFVDPATGGAQ